jgi:amidohydrolase
MNEIKSKIKTLSTQYYNEIVEIRQHLHKYPELSQQEKITSEYISKKLSDLNIKFKNGIAKNGIIATIEGKNPNSKIIALRADMDALPIQEENNCQYKSVNAGIMHACGHDAHTAMLIGAAKILNELKNYFDGTVKLFFQPSEEKFPGGAKLMIEEGALNNPNVQNVFGQHVLPTLESGKVGVKSGMYMASTDEVYITVQGKGGHGATPELVIDSVLIASHIIVALQQIVSRNAIPSIPTTLSFGRIIADGRTNIIPDSVKIEGTFRTFDEKWRAEAHEKIKKIAKNLAEGMGGTCDVFIDKGYPFLVNDNKLAEEFKILAAAYLGAENVVDLEMRMTAEDFAYFSQEVPSCFYRIGVKNEIKGINANLHTSRFDIDEKSMETGMGLMAWLAINNLK